MADFFTKNKAAKAAGTIMGWIIIFGVSAVLIKLTILAVKWLFSG
jgi:hypothetical protein